MVVIGKDSQKWECKWGCSVRTGVRSIKWGVWVRRKKTGRKYSFFWRKTEMRPREAMGEGYD